MEALYEKIKELREFNNMSQDELAKKTGYHSRSSIAKIESGQVDIPQSKINAFAKALNTTPSYLMGWNYINFEPQASKPTDFSDDPQFQKIVSAWKNMTEKERAKMLAILSATFDEHF